MNPDLKQAQLFERLRQLPIEVDAARATQMIEHIAKLPPPKNNGFFKTHLNRILMSFSAIVALVSTLLFFSPNENETIASTSTILMDVATPIEVAESNSMMKTELTMEANPKKRMENAAVLLPTKTIPNLEYRPVKVELQGWLGRTDLSPTAPIRQGVSELQAITKDSSLNGLSPIKLSINGIGTYINKFSIFRLSNVDAKQLKQELRQMLLADQLIDKKAEINTLTYNTKNILINAVPMTAADEKKYRTLLLSYNIQPSPHRKVVLYKKYIIAGDVNADGQFVRVIIQGRGKLKLPLERNLINSPKVDKQPKVKAKKAAKKRLTYCDRPLKFEGNIKQFKNKLTKELQQDKLLDQNFGGFQLTFDPQDLDRIAVNSRWMPDLLAQKYQTLLRQYNIYPCPKRLIEVSNEFIAVGDVTSEGFKGRVNGRVDLKDLEYNFPDHVAADLMDAKTEERPLPTFHSLKVDGLAVVYLSRGETQAAKVQVSGMPIEDLITIVEQGVLTVTTKGEHNGEQIKVAISAPTLKSIEVGGASELYSEDTIQADTLAVEVVDVGAAWLEVEVQQLTTNMKGGDLMITGKAQKHTINWHGRSSHRGTLTDQNLKVEKQR